MLTVELRFNQCGGIWFNNETFNKVAKSWTNKVRDRDPGENGYSSSHCPSVNTHMGWRCQGPSAAAAETGKGTDSNFRQERTEPRGSNAVTVRAVW